MSPNVATKTLTVNDHGNVDLQIGSTSTVLSVQVTDSNYIALPFLLGNNVWYAFIVKNQVGTAPVFVATGTSVTVKITSIMQ